MFKQIASLCSGFFLMLAFYAISPLSATVIVQKNGDVISGKILEEKKDKYVFQSPYGKLQIAKNSISKMILDEKTIELKDIEFKNKKLKARLVSEENNTAVYLTEDGQTIRKEQAKPVEVKPPETEVKPAQNPIDRHKILLGVTGSYGLSTFQQLDTGPSTGGPAPLDQSFHANTLGFQASGHYALFRWVGFGAGFSFYRWSGNASLVPRDAQQISYDAQIVNTSMAITGSAIVSLLGHLGEKNRHDLRAEIGFGIANNAADMGLTFKNPPQGFPLAATASGKARSTALQLQFYYVYSLTESLRLKAGLGYYRAFYNQIYEPNLQGSTPFPPNDKFSVDFNRLLGAEAQNPQIISLQLGAEFGF